MVQILLAALLGLFTLLPTSPATAQNCPDGICREQLYRSLQQGVQIWVNEAPVRWQQSTVYVPIFGPTQDEARRVNRNLARLLERALRELGSQPIWQRLPDRVNGIRIRHPHQIARERGYVVTTPELTRRYLAQVEAQYGRLRLEESSPRLCVITHSTCIVGWYYRSPDGRRWAIRDRWGATYLPQEYMEVVITGQFLD